jgi:hypothetical protein
MIENYYAHYWEDSPETRIDKMKKLDAEMLQTYKDKNHDYGNSFEKSLNEFGLIAFVVRASDKMERIKQLSKAEAKVKDESLKDTIKDLAVYCKMALIWETKE